MDPSRTEGLAEEEVILYLRFGAVPRTRRQVAELLHLPLGAVARMERRVLRKLRRGALCQLRDGWNGWDEV